MGVSIMMIALALIGLWIDMCYIEPNLLIEKKVTVEDKERGKGAEELKIVHFTDTHLGPDYTLQELEKLVSKINRNKPDLVVFTGDLMDHPGQYPYKDKIGEVLSQIESTYGKFAVWGNHDHGGAGVRYFEDIMEASEFTLLQNESTTIQTESGKYVNIMGIDDALLGQVDYAKTFQGVDSSHYGIILMHEPDLVIQADSKYYDLVLTGHSHGGQVQLPFVGPLYTPGLAEIYTHGLYELGDKKHLYVNGGIGTTKMEIRLFNPPQIAILQVRIH